MRKAPEILHLGGLLSLVSRGSGIRGGLSFTRREFRVLVSRG